MLDDEIEVGSENFNPSYDIVKYDKRETSQLSEVTFALECGDSNSLSSITAKPLLETYPDFLLINQIPSG